ncbi:prepilin peptidase [Pseudomonas sp. GCM10022186]|uniref:A24 family peptidase n=1 Tax=Pseudomonas sp. GCM10022186 TaxID=3252650 RepID=UPI003614C8F3
MEVLMSTSAVILLCIAAVSDVSSCRIPNTLILLGLATSFAFHAGWDQVDGLIAWGSGLAVGLLCFLPFYALGGMAAGDVKLMAMAGGFLGPLAAFWSASFSLMAGGVLGILILAYKRQLFRFLKRYWAMASLRTYIRPETGDASRQHFPYAIAILFGTLISVFWLPSGQ